MATIERAHPDYPASLVDLDDAPTRLNVLGDASLLALPQVAIVGSRRATPHGLAIAHEFARRLASGGFVVTSGLAHGVDAAAHRGALDATGRTIAVCATGLDRVYPPSHASLAREIATRGALVSEQPGGVAPHRGLFPRRNRLIAALSLATIVIEADLRSGSLITARLAAELGREVCAVPGSIANPLTRGCHRLIRDGATLVETVDDVVAALSSRLAALRATLSSMDAHACNAAGAPPSDEASRRSPPARAALLDALGHDPIVVDDIVTRSGLTTPVVSSMLTALELEGVVTSLSGGRYQRVRFP